MLDGVSVIVPVYNIKDYLRRALDSYVNQSLLNKEILIIDDGSSDGSEAICEEYRARYEFVKVYHIPNGGLSNARNYGADRAEHEYIVFWDGDDYAEKNTLEEVYKRIMADGSDMVVFGYFMETDHFIEDRKFEFRSSKNMLLKSFEEFNQVELWDGALMYNAWNKLYRTSFFQELNLRFKNLRLVEDVEFNTQYMEYCSSISIVNQCFYHYIRERNGSLTTAYIKNWFEIRCEEHTRLLKYFENHGVHNEALMEFLHRRYIERVLGCIENEFHSTVHTASSTLKYIKNIIRNKEVNRSLKIMKPKSKKVAIMIIPLKMKSSLLTYAMGGLISMIRNLFPQVFMRLKNSR